MLEMRNIVKRFPGVVASDGVDFDVRAGEVHTLLGENGAGKSTLMKILYGLYQADAGEISLEGEPVEITLVVKNVGTLTTGAPATVVGMQNGIEIYSESLLAQSALGGAKTTFTFPSFLPTIAGTISWQATIADDNPDTALAETKVRN